MILNVYKEKNQTSRDVVNILCKHFHTKKVGHTGTLDPIASGVLLVCTDNDTKLVDVITSKTKEYVATMKLGVKTDTGDITGNILEEKEYYVNETKIQEVLKSFLGKSIQTVPIYSAVKVKGKKLYEYARNHEIVELPKREIEIYKIDLLHYEEDSIKFRVVVSKGTYIRSLIEDIALKLDTVGCMSDLIRTKQGDFKIEDANKIEDILKDNYKTLEKKEVLSNYPIYNLTEEEVKRVKNGCKMNFDSREEYLLLCYKEECVAIYQKEGSMYRVYKML